MLEYDFPSDADGVAIPLGIYDVARNEGFVVVGTSHQTPEFAVAAIRRWWVQARQMYYPDQHELLIEADCGNPNGNRCWRWKHELQQLADEFGLTITVTHLPTGASKWNPIEHRLFSQISRNWAGEPLVSYETILKFIRTTKTDSGCAARHTWTKPFMKPGCNLHWNRKNVSIWFHVVSCQSITIRSSRMSNF